MLVVVSTERARVVLVVGIGLTILGALWLLWGVLSGVPAFAAGILAVLVAALTVAYVVAVFVEGRIDRSGRRRYLERLPLHSAAMAMTQGRCGHCRRPLVVVQGVSMCAVCDRQH